jgi:hypothetical protein
MPIGIDIRRSAWLAMTKGGLANMRVMAPRRTLEKPGTTDDDATATAPLIVNGLTVRPREKANPWRYGILFLPDFAVLLVTAGIGMRRFSHTHKSSPADPRRTELAL